MDYPEYEHIEILDSDVQLIGKTTFEVSQDQVERGIETSLSSGYEISIDMVEFKITYNNNDVTKLLEVIEHENGVDYFSQMKKELSHQAYLDWSRK